MTAKSPHTTQQGLPPVTTAQVGVDYPGVTVSFLCHDGEGNFVFNKRSVRCRDEHGRWDCGGGRLEWGDHVENRLRQEIKEEYGADVRMSEFLGYREAHRINPQGKPTHWISLDFLVWVDRTQVHNAEPAKFDAVEWFTLDALPQPQHSLLSKLWDQYGEKLRQVGQSSKKKPLPSDA